MNTSFTRPEFADHERVVFVNDKAAGLQAVIGVHNTQRGPANRGCRMWPYESADTALTDVLRLSRGMTYKNALVDSNSGGDKTPSDSIFCINQAALWLSTSVPVR